LVLSTIEIDKSMEKEGIPWAVQYVSLLGAQRHLMLNISGKLLAAINQKTWHQQDTTISCLGLLMKKYRWRDTKNIRSFNKRELSTSDLHIKCL
jgi:hypothetical protein